MSLQTAKAEQGRTFAMTFPGLAAKKQAGEPITALTAYDYPTARIVDEAGIDLLLVGDSLGMAVLGYESTLPVTLEEMLHHTRAVRRGVRRALVVADMPFGSYQVDQAEGVRNAMRLVKEAGAAAVKIEGARPALAKRLVEAEIAVVAHLGLLPQGVHRMGGYKVQGRTLDEAERLVADALAMEAAGIAVMVLEGVPREVGRRVRQALRVPVIGIGAGPDCDGQILVLHDILNLTFAPAAKFVRRYADVAGLVRGAVEQYAGDVRERRFPAEGESYHLPAEARGAWEEAAAAVGAAGAGMSAGVKLEGVAPDGAGVEAGRGAELPEAARAEVAGAEVAGAEVAGANNGVDGQGNRSGSGGLAAGEGRSG